MTFVGNQMVDREDIRAWAVQKLKQFFIAFDQQQNLCFLISEHKRKVNWFARMVKKYLYLRKFQIRRLRTLFDQQVSHILAYLKKMKKKERERTGKGYFLDKLIKNLLQLDMSSVVVTLSQYFDLCKTSAK